MATLLLTAALSDSSLPLATCHWTWLLHQVTDRLSASVFSAVKWEQRCLGVAGSVAQQESPSVTDSPIGNTVICQGILPLGLNPPWAQGHDSASPCRERLAGYPLVNQCHFPCSREATAKFLSLAFLTRGPPVWLQVPPQSCGLGRWGWTNTESCEARLWRFPLSL